MRSDEPLAAATPLDEPVYGMFASRRATVVYGYGVALAFEIQSEILPHDGQSDQAYVCCFHVLCPIRAPTLSSSSGTVQFSRHVSSPLRGFDMRFRPVRRSDRKAADLSPDPTLLRFPLQKLKTENTYGRFR
jgi:hypothetical protein